MGDGSDRLALLTGDRSFDGTEALRVAQSLMEPLC